MDCKEGNEITASKSIPTSDYKVKDGDAPPLAAVAQYFELVYGKVDITMFEEDVSYVVSFKVKMKYPVKNAKNVKVWYRISPWVALQELILPVDESGEWTDVQTSPFTVASTMTYGYVEFAMWREPLGDRIDLLISSIEFIQQETRGGNE